MMMNKNVRHTGVRKTAFVSLAVIVLAGCMGQRGGEQQPSSTDASHFQTSADTAVSFPEGWPDTFGFGRPVTAAEIEPWDIDVMPDGTGLPAGSGTVSAGSTVYKAKCVTCHGATGTEGPFDRLVGREPRDGFPFGKESRYTSMKTVGNYWPYATTVFDYIRRAMPQDKPGSLSPDEVYAVTAYILHLNEIIPADAVMNSATLPAIHMPARDRFVVDNRRGGAEIK